jgi:hypothetical protein
MRTFRIWWILALDGLILAAYLTLAVLSGTRFSEVFNFVVFCLFPVSGAVILARQPGNRAGWVLVALGLAVCTAGTSLAYGVYATVHSPIPLPLADEFAWLSLALWTLALPCVILLLLLFPNGHLPSKAWRPVPILTAALTLPIYLGIFLIGWPNRHDIIQNEIGLTSLTEPFARLFQAFDLWAAAMIGLIVVALASFITRYRRSRGVERLQLKWFVFGMATIPISMIFDIFAEAAGGPGVAWFNEVLNNLSILAFPVILLISVTRYRLYDIDIIIRRTLLYSAVTFTLALIYFGSVLLLQTLFTRSMGELPAIAIVLSTLLIAALFQPLRQRFQSLIDRRFFRARYNTQQTLDQFAERLRHEVDLEEIQHGLLAVVDENLQPERAALWLVGKKEGG